MAGYDGSICVVSPIPALSGHPVHGADLVAVGIAQIGEIEFADGAFANAWRILARCRAMGDAGGVPGVGLLGRIGGKADGAAIGTVAGSPLIGFDTENVPVLVK